MISDISSANSVANKARDGGQIPLHRPFANWKRYRLSIDRKHRLGRPLVVVTRGRSERPWPVDRPLNWQQPLLLTMSPADINRETQGTHTRSKQTRQWYTSKSLLGEHLVQESGNFLSISQFQSNALFVKKYKLI